ncbi:MAG TPA: hypothetical protein VF881_05610 [Polyangiaceae bacterium]
MKPVLPLGLLMSVGLVTGCGSPFASDPDVYPPLTTVNGELRKDDNFAAPTANTRVAVLWASADRGQYEQAVDLPVQPVFPSNFKIDLVEPPPLDMFDQVNDSPGFKIAHGALVVYEDVNQNGKLDLVDGTSPTFVDRILGANGNLVLVYVDGTLPITERLRDTDGHLPPTLGYNLVSVSCSVTITGMPCDEASHWKTMNDTYDLTLTSDPRLASLMCLQPTETGLCAP